MGYATPVQSGSPRYSFYASLPSMKDTLITLSLLMGYGFLFAVLFTFTRLGIQESRWDIVGVSSMGALVLIVMIVYEIRSLIDKRM